MSQGGNCGSEMHRAATEVASEVVQGINTNCSFAANYVNISMHQQKSKEKKDLVAGDSDHNKGGEK